MTTLLCKLTRSTNNYITDYKGGLSITDPLSLGFGGVLGGKGCWVKVKIETGHLIFYVLSGHHQVVPCHPVTSVVIRNPPPLLVCDRSEGPMPKAEVDNIFRTSRVIYSSPERLDLLSNKS